MRLQQALLYAGLDTRALESPWGFRGYDYIVDDMRNLPVWQAMRVQQWAKNILIFVPALTSHRIVDPAVFVNGLAAFFAFNLCASAGYLINDLADVSADRQHPLKKHRPVAAGTLSSGAAVVLAAALLTVALSIGLLFLSPLFAGVLAFYLVSSLSYSWWWKAVPLVDVMVLAALYSLRIIAGGAAMSIRISPWLLELSILLFLSLALVKRFAELRSLPMDGEQRLRRRGYLASDLDQIRILGAASGYGAAVIMAIYVHSPDSQLLYNNQSWLWLLCPLLAFWVSRVWLLAHRGQMNDDPVVFALKDIPSYVVAALILLVLVFSL